MIFIVSNRYLMLSFEKFCPAVPSASFHLSENNIFHDHSPLDSLAYYPTCLNQWHECFSGSSHSYSMCQGILTGQFFRWKILASLCSFLGIGVAYPKPSKLKIYSQFDCLSLITKYLSCAPTSSLPPISLHNFIQNLGQMMVRCFLMPVLPKVCLTIS